MNSRISQLLLWVNVFIWTSGITATSTAKEPNLQSTEVSSFEFRVSSLEKGEISNSKPETCKRDRFLTASMLSLGAAGLLHLMADNSYQRYDEARDKATAEQERERTELLDNTRNVLIGIAGVCVAIFEYRSYTGAREKAPKMSLKPMIQVDERPSLGWHWTW